MFPLHGLGGLERSVYDLVRYLAGAGVRVTLITRTPQRGAPSLNRHPGGHNDFVPYRTFPFAGRRGTTVLDRSTAYPLFGERAGRLASTLRARRRMSTSFTGSARACSATRDGAPQSAAPLVLNPQGLEEFGATDPSRARMKRAAYFPLRRAVLACARAADCVIATDRVLEPAVMAHLRVDRLANARHSKRARSPRSIGSPRRLTARRVRRAGGNRSGEVVLFSVGRLEHNKGFHVLSAALGALRDQRRRIAEGNWRWVVSRRRTVPAVARVLDQRMRESPTRRLCRAA